MHKPLPTIYYKIHDMATIYWPFPLAGMFRGGGYPTHSSISELHHESYWGDSNVIHWKRFWNHVLFHHDPKFTNFSGLVEAKEAVSAWSIYLFYLWQNRASVLSQQLPPVFRCSLASFLNYTTINAITQPPYFVKLSLSEAVAIGPKGLREGHINFP